MPWLSAGAIVLLTAGFTKFSVVLLNRWLGHPQPKWILGSAVLTQISLVPVYVCLLTINIAGGKLHPLIDDLGSRVSAMFVGILIALGLIGLVQLIYSAIAQYQYRPPAFEVAFESQLIDFRTSADLQPWRETLVGPRPMRRIALLPGNEQFTVEVSTKTYLLPRFPKEWNGFSILHIADSHFCGAVTSAYYQAVCDRARMLEPDLVVFTGDLLDDLSHLDWLEKSFGQLKAPHGQYFVLGNHDWYQNAPAIRSEFERLGWTDMAGRCCRLAPLGSGPPIVLAGDETPWMGTHPDVTAESKDLFRILLSHTPDNITWARENVIDLMLAGHTHGGQIQLPIFGPLYSPSRFGCRFASGVFWLDPTLLYVSRGLSGREPIRYHCSPELTKLVLQGPVD